MMLDEMERMNCLRKDECSAMNEILQKKSGILKIPRGAGPGLIVRYCVILCEIVIEFRMSIS